MLLSVLALLVGVRSVVFVLNVGIRPRSVGGAGSPSRSNPDTDDGSQTGSNGHANKWTVEIRQANCYAKGGSQQRPDPQSLVHRPVGVMRLALICALKCGNIQLAHSQHGLHCTLRALRIRSGDQ